MQLSFVIYGQDPVLPLCGYGTDNEQTQCARETRVTPTIIITNDKDCNDEVNEYVEKKRPYDNERTIMTTTTNTTTVATMRAMTMNAQKNTRQRKQQ